MPEPHKHVAGTVAVAVAVGAGGLAVDFYIITVAEGMGYLQA
jgi:hypothetical protein